MTAETIEDGLCAVTGEELTGDRHWVVSGGRFRTVSDKMFWTYSGDELRRLIARRDAEIGLEPFGE